MSWRFVLSLFFALLVALFAIQNAAVVDVNFLTWKTQLPQGVVIIIAAAIGAVTVFLLSVVKRLQISAAIRGDKKTIANLEEANRNLRTKVDALNQKAVELTAQAEKTETTTKES